MFWLGLGVEDPTLWLLIGLPLIAVLLHAREWEGKARKRRLYF